MMQLNDKTALRLLRNKIDEALGAVAQECGLSKLQTGHIRYEYDGLSAKITVNAEATAKDGSNADEREFKRYAPLFGLKESDLHRKITFGGKRYEIVGLRPNRRKYPVLCRDLNTQKNHLLKPEWIKPEEQHAA